MSKGRIYIEFNCFLVHRKLITILLEIIRTTDAMSFHCFFVWKENSHFVRRNSLPYFPCVVCFLFFFSIRGRNIYAKRMLLGIPVGCDMITAEKKRIPIWTLSIKMVLVRMHIKYKKDKECCIDFFFFNGTCLENLNSNGSINPEDLTLLMVVPPRLSKQRIPVTYKCAYNWIYKQKSIL